MAPMTRKRQASQAAANATAAKAYKDKHGEAAHKPEPAAQSDDEASIITSETPVAGHEQLGVHVEHAKSGRSQCRVCKGEINKGEVRIGMDVEMTRRAPGHMATSWRHVKCFHPPKGMHVDHLVGIEDLSAEERKAVHRHMQAADKAKPASKKPLHHLKTHPEIIAARGVKGRHAAAEQAQQHEHPGDERFQLTDDEDEDEIREKYQSMHVDDLKEVLRANEQLLGGLKDELVERCVDGELNGGLPKCPTCGIGLLKVSEHDAHLFCPGYFDETAAVYVRCAFRAAPDKVARIPWIMPGGERKTKARKEAKARPREGTPESEGGPE